MRVVDIPEGIPLHLGVQSIVAPATAPWHHGVFVEESGAATMAELDKEFAEYHRKWKTRLKLSDRQLGEGYMRGEALDAAGYGTLPDDFTRTGIFVRVDGRGLDAQADHGALPDIIAEWRQVIEGQDTNDARNLSKDFICRTVALNQHLEGENGAMILCATLWLASATPGVMDALTEPGSALVLEFVDDDGTRRMKTKVVGPEDEA